MRKIKLGEDLRDPDIHCYDCNEVSGGSVQKSEEGYYVIKAWCGCYVMDFWEYDDNCMVVENDED